MNRREQHAQSDDRHSSEPISRRSALRDSGLGLGSMALAYLLQQDGLLARDTQAAYTHPPRDLRSRPGHRSACATSVIMLMQTGGPSQMDLFDPKPELQRRDGEIYSSKFESFQPGSQENKLMASPFKFQRSGQCGMEFSDMVPHLASVADDMCMVRSMFSENNNHPQAMRFLNTGSILSGRPTLGAWISYGLGSENQDLPAYIVLRDPDGYADGGVTNWDNGWLPPLYRGTEVQTRGTPILNLHSPQVVNDLIPTHNLQLLHKLNRHRQSLYPNDSELETRILNYELAARMQKRADRVLDLSDETAATHKLYGIDRDVTHDYGMRCLMARRLVESGVRFVHILPPQKKDGAGPWDHHGSLKSRMESLSPQIDQPSAGLIMDLKNRGLLESTIVIWAGEFGRLPISQNGSGRDHNRHAFTLLIAGGGFQKGFVYGATDEFGYAAVQDRVSCHDLHATILWQMGIDHTQLTYLHGGRAERMTDPEVTGASIVARLLA